ncbi:AMP-binding protein [Candidatus Bathyarchaeota archaeon]|nr:AMP-binding protein [Candidatus Bathyarchaeota archaeon]
MSQVHRSKQRILIPTDLSVTEATLLDDREHVPDDKIIFEEAFTGNTATYLGFTNQVRHTAAWLKYHLNITAGDVVTIISPSSIDYVVATHAVWWLGGVVSMINDALSPKDLSHGLEVVQPKFVIAGSTAIDKVEQSLHLASKSVSVNRVVTIGRTASYPCWADVTRSGKDSKQLQKSGEDGGKETPPPLAEIEPSSLRNGDNRSVLAAVVLSSGTTGFSKAVMMSHHNLIAANYQLRADNPQNWRSDMREVFFPPLSHIYATYVVITGAPWLGYYVCLMPRFDLGTYCRLMSERKATLARLVPPVAKMLAESPVTKRYTYPSLEYFTCSAAPLSVSQNQHDEADRVGRQ